MTILLWDRHHESEDACQSQEGLLRLEGLKNKRKIANKPQRCCDRHLTRDDKGVHSEVPVLGNRSIFPYAGFAVTMSLLPERLTSTAKA